MKVKIMSLVAAAGLFFTSCRTTYTSTSDGAAYNVDVPTNIRQSFAIAYPDATTVVWNGYDASVVPIDWELAEWSPLTSTDYAVSFNVGNSPYIAWYNSNGTLVGTTTAITDYTYLPYSVNTLLHDQYGTYTIETVQKEMRGTSSVYEIKLKGTDDSKMKLLVDANGNVIRKK